MPAYGLWELGNLLKYLIQNLNMNDKCKNCKSCLFYRADADDIGTCEITDNIVDAGQDACNDHRSKESGGDE